jgi:transcriptional regulator with XRE-family HTH domain
VKRKRTKVTASSISQSFGEVLRHMRVARDLSQEKLGFESEIHRTYISQLERGMKSPTLDILFRISRALDCEASSIVAQVEKRR